MAARPPLLNQLNVQDPKARQDCGETTVAMLLQAGGVMDTPLEVIAALNHDGTTYVPELVRVLTDNRAKVVPIAAAFLRDGLADGVSYELILIHDDSNGDPAAGGAFTHWIGGYRDNPGGFTVQCVNPWGGRDCAYATATLVAATIWAATVRFPHASPPAPTPVPTPTPTPRPPSNEDDSMIAPMWDATTAAWQGNQNIAWVDAAGALNHRWSGEQGQPGGHEVVGTGLVPQGDIDLFIDAVRQTIHLKARTSAGRLFHAFEVGGKPWGSEIL